MEVGNSGERAHERYGNTVSPVSQCRIYLWASDSIGSLNISTSKEVIELFPYRDGLSYCVVCKNAFEIGIDFAFCRHELPADAGRRGVVGQALMGTEDNSIGLTIWRLPGDGLAVGRFFDGLQEEAIQGKADELEESFETSSLWMHWFFFFLLCFIFKAEIIFSITIFPKELERYNS